MKKKKKTAKEKDQTRTAGLGSSNSMYYFFSINNIFMKLPPKKKKNSFQIVQAFEIVILNYFIFSLISTSTYTIFDHSVSFFAEQKG